MTLELENLFEVQVLGFLKSCQGDTPIHGTRRALSRLASITAFPSVSGSTSSIASNRSSVSSFNDGDSGAVKSEYCKHLRSGTSQSRFNGVQYSSGEDDGACREENESVSVDGSLSSFSEEVTRISTRRTTRSMLKVENKSWKESEEIDTMRGSVSQDNFGMKLRRRRKRPLPNCDSEGDDSESQNESEEEKLKEEEADDYDAAEDWNLSTSSKRYSKRTSSRSSRVLRKRRKVLIESDEEDREQEVLCSAVTTSRSGRVVKPIIRGDC